MKRDQVSTKKPAEQFFTSRQDGKDVRSGEWNMEEITNGGIGKPLAEKAGKQHQMVIMNPDTISRAELGNDSITEEMIRDDVCFPAICVEVELGSKVVKQRPKRLVGVSLVKCLNKVGGHVDRDAGLFFAEKFERLRAFVALRAGPANPNAARLFEDGVHGSRQAAGAPF